MGTKVDARQLALLSNAGVRFEAHLFDGWFVLTSAEVERYLDDPVGLVAEKHGVSVQIWKL